MGMERVRIPQSMEDDELRVRRRDVLVAVFAGVLVAGASLRWLNISGALVAGLIIAAVVYVIASRGRRLSPPFRLECVCCPDAFDESPRVASRFDCHAVSAELTAAMGGEQQERRKHEERQEVGRDFHSGPDDGASTGGTD
jgi:hypothetical protein